MRMYFGDIEVDGECFRYVLEICKSTSDSVEADLRAAHYDSTNDSRISVTRTFPSTFSDSSIRRNMIDAAINRYWESLLSEFEEGRRVLEILAK